MANPHVGTRHQPIIRVFVSSTFSDLKHERNALQREVFPKLEQLCLQRGFQFQAIDLRWGVPTEAGLDHRTMQICIEELRRSQKVSPLPNFLILLGDRYGWRPLPEAISTDEFESLEAAAKELDGGATLGPTVNLLRRWYLFDSNSVPPVHVLRSRRQHIPSDGIDYTEPSVWRDIEQTLWRIINRACPANGLATRFVDLPKPGRVRCSGPINDLTLPPVVRFQTSATEQEIWHGALTVPDANEHVIAVIRKIANLEDFSHDPRCGDFVDIDDDCKVDRAARYALLQLEEELQFKLSNVYLTEDVTIGERRDANGNARLDITTDHIRDLCNAVLTRLKKIIDNQMDMYWQIPSSADRTIAPSDYDRFSRELELERESHQRFADKYGPIDGFVGRRREIAAILDYLINDDSRLLVVHGASGCGKTALIAYVAREASQYPVASITVVRFIGTTTKSSDLRSLFVNLCSELRRSLPLEYELPIDIQELTREFYGQLARATLDRPVHVFLDALDQLEDTDRARQLKWLRSTPLPPHAKIVVSCLSDQQDEDLAEPFQVLKQRGMLANDVSLSSLSYDEACNLIFDTWLRRADRTVNSAQRQAILTQIQSEAASECRSPLYLKILFEEARQWRSFDKTSELGANVAALLASLFDRLSKSSEHGPAVAAATGYIVSARYGLTENELLEVLFDDPEFKEWLDSSTMKTQQELPPDAKRIPLALWSRLRFDLSPFLLERGAPGGNVLRFYHREIERVVRDLFLADSPQSAQRHRRLADYFANESRHSYFLESLEDQRIRAQPPYSPRVANLRKVTELPEQLFRLLRETRIRSSNDESENTSQRIEELFLNIDFLEANNEGGRIFELVNEISCARRLLSENQSTLVFLEQAGLLEEALRRDIFFIARNRLRFPQALFQSVWNRMKWLGNDAIIEHYVDISQAMNESQMRLADALTADTVHECFIRPLVRRWIESRSSSETGPFLVAARPPQERLQGDPVVVLCGHHHEVRCIAWSPDAKVVATGSKDATIRLWDADTGELIQVLDGHSGQVTGVAFTAAGNCLVSASDDGTLRTWDWRSGSAESEVAFESTTLRDLSVSRGGKYGEIVAVGLGNGNVAVRLLEPSMEIVMIDLECGPIVGVSVDARGESIVAISQVGHFALIQLDLDSAHTTKWDTKIAGGADVAITPDGKRFAIAQSTDILLWEVGSDRPYTILVGHTERILRIDYNDIGTHLAGTAFDGKVWVWDAGTGNAEKFLAGHSAYSVGIAFSPDGTRVGSTSVDGTARLWGLRGRQDVGRLRGHRTQITCLCVSDDGGIALTGDSDGNMIAWSPQDGTIIRIDKIHESELTIGTILTPPHIGMTIGPDRKAGLSIRNVAVSADGARSASCADSEVNVKSLLESNDVWSLKHLPDIPTYLKFDPPGEQLAIGYAAGLIELWDIRQRTMVTSLQGHVGAVLDAEFDCSGKMLVTGGIDGTARVWSLPDGKMSDCFSGHDGGAIWVGLSDKSAAVLTCDGHNTGWEWALGSSRATRLPEAIYDRRALKNQMVLAMVKVRDSNAPDGAEMVVMQGGTNHEIARWDANYDIWTAVPGDNRWIVVRGSHVDFLNLERSDNLTNIMERRATP